MHNSAAAQQSSSGQNELSFEDFTAMSPFLDPAALHLNPYASSLAASSAAAAASNAGELKSKFLTSRA